MKYSEVIRQRKSTRTYSPRNLPVTDINDLKSFAESLSGPFEPRVRLEFIGTKSSTSQDEKGIKIGTYGVIKGARDYVAGVVRRGTFDLEQLGYVLEHLILYATSKSFGTCWLGGTFNKNDLGKSLKIDPCEWMPAITPVGIPKNRESLLSRTMKWGAKSATRKSWEELFFLDFSLQKLSTEIAGDYQLPLEMLRLAPSASNKQPWRIIKDRNRFHFYLCENKWLSRTLGFPLQRVDIGIAMCHFELCAREVHLEGSWKRFTEICSFHDAIKGEYIISWEDCAFSSPLF